MKYLSTLLAALIIPAFLSTAYANGDPDATTIFQVNPEKSSLTWNAYKVTGEHEGNIDIQEGHFKYKDGELVDGSFKIDMSSITVTDLEGESKSKLENHLRTDDFFNAKKFPVSTFDITDVASHPEDGAYKVTGDMTIRDKTHEISFPVHIRGSSGHRSVEADLKIDRSKYNVRFRSDSFFDNLGDKMIYDEFDLSIQLSADKMKK